MGRQAVRETTVRDIDLETAEDFITQHHHDPRSTAEYKVRSFGVFSDSDDELLGVAQFCSPRTPEMKKEYTTELLHLSFTQETMTAGAVNALFTHYIEKHHPADIFTYEDNFEDMDPELFIDMGWDIVDTPDGLIYEWVDPDRTHYTYKITASGSEKYYYGVSHVKIKDASIEDCQNHHYYGSGGKWEKNNKFINWKKKHEASLQKEVLQTFTRKHAAYEAEKKLIGDLWKTDELCLNSHPGGGYTGFSAGVSVGVSMKECSVHGMKKHIGERCATCLVESNVSLRECSLHGEIKHIGAKCRRCIASNTIAIKECSVHGMTKHSADVCYQCMSERNITLRVCAVHGETKHLGKTCQKCANYASFVMEECDIHGMTKHKGGTCQRCVAGRGIAMKECSVHGMTKHHGDACSTCTAEKSSSIGECDVHGETKHYGDQCVKCRAEDSISVRECSVHGETKHIGDKCFRCRASGYTTGQCETHGETTFQSGVCNKCRFGDILTMKECAVHGLVTHMGGSCSSCRSQNAIGMRECSIHGMTKHRGKACSSCTADKASHRHHTAGKTRKKCSLCIQEIRDGLRSPLEDPLKEKLCSLCQQLFKPKHKKQLFCQNPHPHQCDSCGDDISPVPRKEKIYYSCTKRECKMRIHQLCEESERASVG